MSPIILHHRIRCLSRAAALGLVAGLAAGCSSDFTRFDRTVYSALPTAEEAAAYNPYPNNVDPVTTASVQPGKPMPLGDVATARSAPDHAGYDPTASAYSGNQQTIGTNYNAGSQSAQRSGVVRSSLPDPVGSGSSAPIPAVDPISTSSVQQPVSTGRPATASGVGGWSGAGGTSVTIQPGETLYNLSKRYGVPVREIMQANNLTDANSIRSGQRVVIPTYVYSSRAPVSAPDNDKKVQQASAGRGAVEASTKLVPAPKIENADVRGGQYTVSSGDTLSGIAAKTGTTVANLKQINGLQSDTVRIGQKLRISASDSVTPVAPVAEKSVETASIPAIDPIVTGSAKTASGPKAYTKPKIDPAPTASVNAEAPATSGIDRFRWPVKGRVISSFGSGSGAARNDGIDISVPEGTPVKAAENGIVIYADSLQDFGNLVLVRHANGYVTAYAHNKANQVSKGQTVTRGETIALSGRTGKAQVPMLHFEVRKNSKPVDPIKYLGG